MKVNLSLEKELTDTAFADSTISHTDLRVINKETNKVHQLMDRSKPSSIAGSPDAPASGLMWMSFGGKNKLACFYLQRKLHMGFWSDPHPYPCDPRNPV